MNERGYNGTESNRPRMNLDEGIIWKRRVLTTESMIRLIEEAYDVQRSDSETDVTYREKDRERDHNVTVLFIVWRRSYMNPKNRSSMLYLKVPDRSSTSISLTS